MTPSVLFAERWKIRRMKEYKFSVIIPIYKVEEYLKECIDSVLQQTYCNLEIILVDDGSPDSCPVICDEYAEQFEFIKVIHKKNGGLSDARNTGLDIATGEYVIFLDSDDYWGEKDFLKKVNSFIISQSSPEQIDIILFQAKKFVEASQSYILDQYYSSEHINSIGKDDTLRYLLETGAYSMQACTKILRREFLQDNEIVFVKNLLGEDLDWFLQVMFKVDDIYAVDDINYIYRIRKGSITNTIGIKNLLDTIWMLQKWSNEIKQANLTVYQQTNYYGILAYAYVVALLNYRSLSKSNQKKIKSELKNYSFLLRYAINKRIKLTNICYKLLGFEITSKLLNWYYKNK